MTYIIQVCGALTSTVTLELEASLKVVKLAMKVFGRLELNTEDSKKSIMQN